MTQRNKEWYSRYEDGTEYINKGLMTQEELDYLKVDTFPWYEYYIHGFP